MVVRARTLVGPLVVVGAILLGVVWVDASTPLRGPVTVLFLLLAPGASIVAHLQVPEPALELSLIVAVSLAVDVLVAQSLVWTGSWSPRIGLTVLVAANALSALSLAYTRIATER